MTLISQSVGDLAHVASALGEGRLTAPFSCIALERLGVSDPQPLIDELNRLSQSGFDSAQIALLFRAVLDERSAAAQRAVKLELAVSGPDLHEQARDTAVIVEQLFSEATASVLLVGFALYDGNLLFRHLASRLDAMPGLKVTLCLDISRRGTDTTKDADLIARYAHEFRKRHWPGKRMPAIYFDPRGLSTDYDKRAVLHAKCILIDEKTALVTSANPTPAAYTKNIELGIVIRGGVIPGQIAHHFSSLIESGFLRRLDLPIQ